MEIVHEYFACWPIMGKTDAKFWLDNRDSLESLVLLNGHYFSLNHGKFFLSKQGGWKRETIVTKEALSCHFTMKRTVLTTWIKTKLQLLLTLVLIYGWCRLKENNSISWTFSCIFFKMCNFWQMTSYGNYFVRTTKVVNIEKSAKYRAEIIIKNTS